MFAYNTMRLEVNAYWQHKNRKILHVSLQCNAVQHSSKSFHMDFQSHRVASQNIINQACTQQATFTATMDFNSSGIL